MKSKEGSFDPDEFDRLAAATVPGYATLQDLVALTVAVGLPKGARVLDVGCGTGTGILALARAAPDATLVACDPVLPMVVSARARCAAAGIQSRIEHGTIEAIADEPVFDVVVSTLVMHFIPMQDRVTWLRALRSRLRPGGRLVLTVLARDTLPHVNECWAQLRKQYATNHDYPLEVLAKRQAQTQMDAVMENDLHAQIVDAGFRPAIPIVQLLAVKCWQMEK